MSFYDRNVDDGDEFGSRMEWLDEERESREADPSIVRVQVGSGHKIVDGEHQPYALPFPMEYIASIK